MDPLLLQTKISIPPLNPKRIARPSLIDRLQAGLGGRLTLLSAPPGFGKTSLVQEWLPAIEPRYAIAWLSLDEDDNDPARFWRYLTAAIEQALPGSGPLAAGLPLGGPTPPPKALVATLINGLAGLTRPLLLVLDDYHAIQTPEIHEALAFLIGNQPQGLHLALTSREDPPLPLARLRARGQLTELRASDLRFDPPSADAFLNGLMGLQLPPDAIAVLAERTEGWAAGLQLAGLSLQDSRDRQGFVSAFTGSHRYVFDYLVEEILTRQSPELQRFLLETSVLERLSGPLCDAVTGRNDGQAMLETLEQANLLLIPLDDERRWYRYHHLFADVLRLMLQRTHPEEVAALHRRASLGFEQQGGVSEAVTHALKAQDFPRASELLWQAEPLWRRGETRALRSWLTRLPEETLDSQPRLYLLHAWTLVPTGRFDELQQLLDRAEAAYRRSPDPDPTAQLTALRAYLARWKGEIPEAIRLAQESLAMLPEGDWMWRGLVALSLAAATRFAGELDEAARIYAGIAARCWREEPYYAIVATCLQAAVCSEAGQLRSARALYQEALDSATRLGGRSWGVTGYALVGLGEIMREGDRPHEAAALLDEGLTCGSWLPQVTIHGALSLAHLHAAHGEADDAQRALAIARSAADETGSPQAQHVLNAGMAAIWPLLTDAQRAALRLWADTLSPEVPEGPMSDIAIEQLLALATIRLHDGMPEAAGALLAALIDRAGAAGRGGVALRAMALRVQALERLDRKAEAEALLARARALGEPEGYVRLLAACSGAGRSGAERSGAVTERVVPRTDTLVERLSDRELEVLRLIASGATNQHIADTLTLSLATAKKHSSNILGKLGAGNRTEAVARARELGLI